MTNTNNKGILSMLTERARALSEVHSETPTTQYVVDNLFMLVMDLAADEDPALEDPDVLAKFTAQYLCGQSQEL